MKSERNKTIDISVEQGKEYLERVLSLEDVKNGADYINKTVCADSFKALCLMGKGFADLAIVDPIYNLDKEFGSFKVKKTSEEKYRQYTREWIEALLPTLKKSASVYVCCDWRSSMVIGPVLEEYFEVKNRITWQREKGRGAAKNWKNGMEDIWFCTVSSKDYLFNLDAVRQRRRVIAPYTQNGQPKDWQEGEHGRFRDTCPSNFWDDISIPYWSMPENTAHPTQKPEKLIAKLILASSNPGDVVIDPFLGSGSTSVAAKKLGRRYVGIEQNEQYCVWAEKRLSEAFEGADIQGYSDGVFWDRNTGSEQRKYKDKVK